jgi:hypothetical protein
MANIVITSGANYVDVEFGIYVGSNSLDGRRATYKKDDISIVWLEKDDSIVYVKMKDYITNDLWPLSYIATPNAFVIDSIDGDPITSNIDLFNKINALR